VSKGDPVKGLTLVAGCDCEPKRASTATLFNKEEVHDVIQELDSQIGALEGDVEDFDLALLGQENFSDEGYIPPEYLVSFSYVVNGRVV
jgi:hypothetical protein